MPAVQTTYDEQIGQARAGLLGDTGPKTTISRTVETAAGVGFGLAVAQGANDKGCIAVEAGVTEILGVTVRETSTDAENHDVFTQYMDARVLTEGSIWVQAAGAVAAGDDVYVTVATGAFGNASGAGIVQIPDARWETSTTAAGLAKIRLK